jgi:hypothetical protein
VAAFLIWWPFLAAIYQFHQMRSDRSGYNAVTNDNWDPQLGDFWSFKVGDVVTWGILLVQASIFVAQAYLAQKQRVAMNGQLEATQAAADAAVISAQTAISIELPLFVIEKIRLAHDTGSAADGHHTVVIKNEGRTAARIIADFLHVHTGHSLPNKPLPFAAHHERAVEVFIPTGSIVTIARDDLVDAATWTKLMESKTVGFLIGYIDYIDFMENVRRYAFCFAGLPKGQQMYTTILPSAIAWVRHGGAAYNYHTALDDAHDHGAVFRPSS